MKRSIAYIILYSIVAVIAAVCYVKTAHAEDKPVIQSDLQSKKDHCQKDDPIGPCFGRLLVIKNPLNRHVTVTVQCNTEIPFTVKKAVLKNSTGTLEVGFNAGLLDKDQCIITKWYFPWTPN